ncbi:MAG: redoxin family protein [Gemmatimonadales bacterium]
MTPVDLTTNAGNAGIGGNRAKGAVIFLFRTDCPACQAQKSDWQVLANAARESGLDVYAITSETLSLPIVRNYFDASTVEVAQFDDPASFARDLWAAVVPTTIIVTAKGRVVFHHAGVMGASAVEQAGGVFKSSSKR